VAAPFKQAEFDIEFGKGISTSGCLIDYGIEHNIITKSGSFFSYGEERLGQGRGNAKAFLDEHQDMAKEIERKIYEALGVEPASPLGVIEAPPPEVEEDAEEAPPASPVAEEQAA
jgi:recombination protein RecA